MADAPPAPREPDDFDRILASFKAHGVEFMVVGGYAVSYHGYVRVTKDLDLFIRRTHENAARVVAALESAGFGFPELTTQAFIAGKGIILGEPPMRVDIISDLPGVRFEEAWPNCPHDHYGDALVPYIGLDDLLRNKRAAGRAQDLTDAAMLEKTRRPER